MSRPRVLILLVLALAASTAAPVLLAGQARGAANASGLGGSESCRECHESAHDLWSTSRHGLTVQPFTKELAATHLPAGQPRRFEVEDSRGRRDIDPVFAVGGKNVFYFLARTERGRLQTLPLAYDVRRGEWYDAAESALRHFGGPLGDAPLAWTDRAFTFDTSCHRCHVSGAESHYDAGTDTYRSTWTEPGISCESCHGPGGEHVRVARATKDLAGADSRIANPKRFTVEQRNALCAPCHARSSPLTDASRPGDAYFDHYDLATLESPEFYPDGRDLGETYTYTSWSLSPCVRSGRLDCLHCHTSSGRFLFAGRPNEACAPCHAGRVRDPAPHTRHRPDGPGSACIACHMPATEFARMRRSDHSMRPPAPAATRAFGSPNACTLCHAGESADWADAHVRSWHARDYQQPLLDRARLIDAARRADWTRLDEMLAYVRSGGLDEVFAASLLRLMRSCGDARKLPVIREALSDPSPLVRSAAAEAHGDEAVGANQEVLEQAASDSVRLVRVRAASILAHARRGEGMPASGPIEAAIGEYARSLACRPDDPVSLYNLGNLHAARGQTSGAIEAFERSLRLDSESVAAFVNVSVAYSAAGRLNDAESALEHALAVEPENTAANLNLGLLLGESGRMDEAEARLAAALAADSTSAQAAYNLAVVVSERGRPDEAIAPARRAARLRPDEPKYAFALCSYLARADRTDEAMAELRRLIERHPAFGEAHVLLAELERGE